MPISIKFDGNYYCIGCDSFHPPSERARHAGHDHTHCVACNAPSTRVVNSNGREVALCRRCVPPLRRKA